MMKKTCVPGLGYVGLPTLSLLANKGFGVDGGVYIVYLWYLAIR